MSSRGGPCSWGNRAWSTSTICDVSSTDKVVWVRYARSPSGSSTVRASSRFCTRIVRSGACPLVPSTSSWPAWPINTIERRSSANRRASTCTFVTSGQVASISPRPALTGFAIDARGRAVRRQHRHRPLRDLGDLFDEDRTQGLEVADDVQVVDDLLADVDGWAVHRQRAFHRLHGTLHAGAVSPRRREENGSTHATMVAPSAMTCGHASKLSQRLGRGRVGLPSYGRLPSGPPSRHHVCFPPSQGGWRTSACWQVGRSVRGQAIGHTDERRQQEVMRHPRPTAGRSVSGEWFTRPVFADAASSSVHRGGANTYDTSDPVARRIRRRDDPDRDPRLPPLAALRRASQRGAARRNLRPRERGPVLRILRPRGRGAALVARSRGRLKLHHGP